MLAATRTALSLPSARFARRSEINELLVAANVTLHWTSQWPLRHHASAIQGRVAFA